MDSSTSTTALPTAERDRFALIRERLYTPVVGDILDELGKVHQFLPPAIQGMDSSMIVVGRAMPVLIAQVFGKQTAPFGRMTEALDQLQDGDVYLAKNAPIPTAAWGEILTTTARHRGAVGAVIDGHHRDTRGILEQNWPVFSHGAYGQDAGVRTAVVDFRVPIEVGGVAVTPGDLVFGDIDGVVVIPASLEDEVLERALGKAAGENVVRNAIENGMSATEAFRTFGIL